MSSSLDLADRSLVVVGAGSHVGRLLATTAAARGAHVVLAGPDLDGLHGTAALVEAAAPRAARRPLVIPVDLTVVDDVVRLAETVGTADHVVSTAAVPANGPLRDLAPEAVHRAFAAKVYGPLFLAQQFADRLREGGSLTFFSGVAAWRPAPQRTVMATTNGALAFLVQALAVEIAPVRVNAVSPGIVDSGAWEGLGDAKAAFLRGVAERNPARRVGRPEDLVDAVLFAIGNPYVTGTVLHVDGGGRLA